MNYDGFIDRVNDKVRTDDEWPVSASATAEQVELSYLAAIAVAATLPLSAFTGSFFTDTALTGATSVLPALDKYVLPNTMFRFRDDLGISTVSIDGIEYQLFEAQNAQTIRQKARNNLYKDSVLFSIDLKDRLLYVLTGQSVKVRHLTEFTKPAVADIGSTTYPLTGTHAEQAATIAASHVLGELKRDPAGAQFQTLLNNIYSTTNPQPAE